MSRYRYEIAENENFAIRCWDDGNPNENGAPFLYQPDWPNATPWASRAEAEFWAEAFIRHMEDPKNGRPGDGPDNAFIPWSEDEQPVEE